MVSRCRLLQTTSLFVLALLYISHSMLPGIPKIIATRGIVDIGKLMWIFPTSIVVQFAVLSLPSNSVNMTILTILFATDSRVNGCFYNAVL